MTDYACGSLKVVDVRLRERGYVRVGPATYRGGDRTIKWVGDRDHLLGIDGRGRTLLIFHPGDDDLAAYAKVRGFNVVYS